MPDWLGSVIAGVATLVSMMALLSVDGEPDPLRESLICGVAVALIVWTLKRFAGWSGPTFRREATRGEHWLVGLVGAGVLAVVLLEILVRYA